MNAIAGLNRMGNSLTAGSNFAAVYSGLPLRGSPGTGVLAHVRGELNTVIIGFGDDGGYGGGWLPLVALKTVLRGILKQLGVLWLFARLPELLKEILGSILKDNDGALSNLDQEQPALRFFIGHTVHEEQTASSTIKIEKSRIPRTNSTLPEDLSSCCFQSGVVGVLKQPTDENGVPILGINNSKRVPSTVYISNWVAQRLHKIP